MQNLTVFQLSNEFEFPIAAFHHAHEAYLVPDVLKQAYGGKSCYSFYQMRLLRACPDTPPASAMFATFARYKREAYRHSEFAPRILNDNGLKVVMKVCTTIFFPCHIDLLCYTE